MSGFDIAGLTILIGGLLFLACSIAYLIGAYKAAKDFDDTFEIAKCLGAYGQLLRIEADALGVTVEELLARDARLGQGNVTVEVDLRGPDDALAAQLRRIVRRNGGGDAQRALGGQ